VAHRPGNAIGWIFSAIGLLAATGGLAQEYAQYAYVTRPGSLPGAVLAAWYASWWWYPAITLALVFTLLWFPSGRPLSARWRPVAVVAAIATAALVALTALQPTLTLRETDYAVDNPIGLAGIQHPQQSTVGAGLFLLLTGCMLAAVLSMVLRFRRSRRVERQQLKWFTYAGPPSRSPQATARPRRADPPVAPLAADLAVVARRTAGSGPAVADHGSVAPYGESWLAASWPGVATVPAPRP